MANKLAVSDTTDESNFELLEYYRTYPAIAAIELLNVDLPISQQVLLDAMWKNKFSIITAGRGCGKCVVGDTLIPTSAGFFRIDELGSELEPLSDFNTQVIGYDGVNNTSKWYYDGVQPVNRISTSFGYSIGATDEHKIKVLDADGLLVWKKSSDIVVGDVVAINRSRELWAGNDQCSPGAAVVMGLLVGDGCFRGCKNALSFTNGDDEVLGIFKKLFSSEFGYTPWSPKNEGRCPSLNVSSSVVWEKLEALGVENNTLSADKVIPASVMRSGKEVMASFLRGLFEADGGCEGARVSYTTKSMVLAKQVHTVLLNFGIISSLRTKRVLYKGEFREYQTISITSTNIEIYQREIGFLSTRKAAALSTLCGKERNPNKDVVPNNQAVFKAMWSKTKGLLSHRDRKVFDKHFRYYDPSYDTLQRCIDLYPFNDGLKDHLEDLYRRRYFFDTVTSTQAGLSKVYDFVVAEDDHSFVANGFINHNTFLLSVFASLKAMLYPGTRVGLIAPSFRQCVVGSTYVLTESGMQRVAELPGPPRTLASSLGVDECSHMFRNPPERTIKLTLGNGIQLEGAEDHRVMVLDEHGEQVFKTLSAVCGEDSVCLKSGTGIFGKSPVTLPQVPEFVSRGNLRDCSTPTVLTEDFAYFLGLLTGDGCLTVENYIGFTSADDDLLCAFTRLCERYAGQPSLNETTPGVFQAVKGSRRLFSLLRDLGLAGKYAYEKSVSEYVLKSSANVQASYIRGLFDTDGCAYFNKGVSHPYKLNIGFSSEVLTRQLQLMLLNFGVVGSLLVREHEGRRPMFILEVSSKSSVLLFRELIGFGLERKQAVLDKVCSHILEDTDTSRENKDYVPNIGPRLEAIVRQIRKFPRGYGDLHLYRNFDSSSKYTGGPKSITRRFLKNLLDVAHRLGVRGTEWVEDILSSGLIFSQPKSKEFGFDFTYDFTVERSHNYVSNGVISHNSKMIFEEVRKLWLASPIFREATAKKPTFQSDRCILEFRSVAPIPPSMIEAVPLGTGEKIRGARFHVILSDEFAQLPEEIFDAVIKPMAATSSNPMERVKQVARLKGLRELGVSEEELQGQLNTNTIIMVSSAYYKFNHMYARIQEYEKMIAEGKPGYAVAYANYMDMPEGFMNEDVLEEARATMPASLFRMEYLGIWESDSDGVFKASLLQSRTLEPGDSVSTEADPACRYIVACDPARTNDFFAIVVFEMKPTGESKVCYAEHESGVKFPAMADRLMDICDRFKPEYLVMDSQGGGLAIKDLLADETRYGNRIILDINDEEYFGVEGNHILEMVNPSPNVNSECVWSTLNLLENSKLFFAGYPTTGKEAEETAYESISELIKQLLAIVVTSTKSGQAHFDVPSGGGHGVQKKDLFSAFIYGGRKIAQLERAIDTAQVLWTGGLIYDRHTSSSGRASSRATSHSAMSSAVLKQSRK